MSFPNPAFRRGWLLRIAVAGCALGGCYHGTAHSVTPSDLETTPGWQIVDGMRMVHQESERDCGAAALSMMLERWGTAAPTRADVLRDAPADAEKGMAAGALRDVARQRGLAAFLIHGQLDDLVREVSAQRPVLVGLIQRYGQKAYAHYEVVVGVNPRQQRLLLFDPGRGAREDGFEGFAAEWKGSAQLALVVTGKTAGGPP